MRSQRLAGGAALLGLLAACGGGGGPVNPAPTFTAVKQVRVSQPSTFTAGCDGVASTGTLYVDTATEPYLAVNPASPANLIAAWQQNRWSDSGSQGLGLAASFDGGASWTLTQAAFSRCTGGGAGNAGNYARASDVWLAVSPSGAAYALSLSFTGQGLTAGSASGMLVAQSTDGGLTWSLPQPLIQDGAGFFNDKGSISADPIDSHYVYAVWDRLTSTTQGPSYLAMTATAGASWQAARSIYDPGAGRQTLGNQIAVIPALVVDVFTELDNSGGASSSAVRAIQSRDHGATWSAPVTVSALAAVGTVDPHTGKAVRDGSNLVSVSAGPGGVLYVVWQDSRFSGGQHDGIAMTHSADGGLSWSVPVQVNGEPSVQAFTPTIDVRADGVIAVTYFDLRHNTVPGSFLTDCWMVISADGGVTFQESHLSGPFNLDLAADAGGLFLGDYQSLANAGGTFLPFYVQTDPGTAVRSDAFISFPAAVIAAKSQAQHGRAPAGRSFAALAAPPGVELSAAGRLRVAERIRRVQAERLNRAP